MSEDEWDTEDWHPDLQDLAEEYSAGYVITAFRVRESLAEEGYPGIHFTDSTEAYLRKIKNLTVKPQVESEMNEELRKRGLQ